MLVKYFEIIDTISSCNLKKLTPYLVLLYFPAIISVFVYTSVQNDNSGDLNSIVVLVVLLGLIFFSPMLMIPSWYKIRNKNFFAFKQLYNDLKSTSLESFSFNRENLDNTIEHSEIDVKQSNEIDVKQSKLLYLYSYLFRGKCELKDLFVPNKKVTKVKEQKLREFSKIEAGKYFETMDYNAEYLLYLLREKKEIGLVEKIRLYDTLENHKIKKLLSDLKAISGINEVQLAKLFSSFDKRTKKHVSLNFNSIKSSNSQRVDRLKS